jgi:hypothetical protein
MIDAKSWIEYLDDPLVLAGFGLLVFASVVAVVMKQQSTVSVYAKSVIGLLFILALIIVVGGLWLAGNKPAETEQEYTTIQQQTEGIQSPAISSGKSVNIQYGSPTKAKPEEKLESLSKPEAATALPLPSKNATIIQHTQGGQSPAIQAGEDVNIQFDPSQ